MKLVNLVPLKEIDFRNQDAFDAYQKQHQLRPDTKVTIAGKPTTAGQAAQQSKDKDVKGTSVFGKDKGGKVFGGDKSKSKQITDDDVHALTSYKDFTKFFKANFDKFDEEDLPYVEDEMGALKYLESDYKRGDADWEEVLVAYEDLQDLFKRALSKNDTSDIKGKADPNADSFTNDDLYSATFKDPETGKTITVGDAYDREDDSPAYKKALAYLSKFDPDKEAIMGTKAYDDLQKKATGNSGSTKLSEMIPKKIKK